MNQQALIEKMGKAIYDDEPNYEDDPVCSWDKLGCIQKRYLDMARAALTAYAEAVGERVIPTPVHRTFAAINSAGCSLGGVFTIGSDEILVARKVGTDGK